MPPPPGATAADTPALVMDSSALCLLIFLKNVNNPQSWIIKLQLILHYSMNKYKQTDIILLSSIIIPMQMFVLLLATFNFKPRPLQLPFVVFIAWSCGLRFWVALQKQKMPLH